MSTASPTAAPPSTPPDRPLGHLVKHSAIYSAAPIVRQLVSIGMTRLYTEWLGNAGFGIKENVDLWMIALQQVLGYNVLAAMMRFFFEQKDERDRGAVVSSLTILVTVTALVCCGLAYLFVPSLTPLMLGRGGEVGSGELVAICSLMLALVPFQMGSCSGFYYLMSTQRSGLYTGIQTAKLFLEIGLNFWFLGHLGLGVRGFLYSMLIGEALTSTALCTWMFVRMGLRVDLAVVRPVLAYAAPMIPVGLLQLLLHNLDRRLILAYVGQDATGTYGLGYKIATLVTHMVLGPFIQIWQPWIFAVENRAERARLVSRVGTYSVLAVATVTLGVMLFGRQAAMILGKPSFWGTYTVIPIVALGYLFWALYHVSQTPLFLEKRTDRLLLVNFLAVLVNVGVNLLLIPRMGIEGAAVATLATFAVLAVLGVLVGRHTTGMHFELGRLTTVFVCASVAAGTALWIDVTEDAGALALWSAVALKATVLVLLLGVYWGIVLRPEERAHLVSWVAAKLRRAPRAS